MADYTSSTITLTGIGSTSSTGNVIYFNGSDSYEPPAPKPITDPVQWLKQRVDEVLFRNVESEKAVHSASVAV